MKVLSRHAAPDIEGDGLTDVSSLLIVSDEKNCFAIYVITALKYFRCSKAFSPPKRLAMQTI
jgi:hypothetical protein